MTFDVADLLRGIVDLMQPSAREKGLQLSLTIGRGLAPFYIGDAGKLRQIVFNLVSNAIKFTERGSVRVRVAATAASKPSHALRITVKDTGIGIATDQQGHIFDSFTQTDASVTRRYGGTGLGLAISRGFAQAMAGTLSVVSEPGKGSTFTLEIEMQRASRQRRKRTPSRPRAGDATIPLHVLVVEDDAATRLVAMEFLARLGHKAHAVHDGYKAIAEFNKLKPDMVLMDISMPGMDGIATAERLRAVPGAKAVPIIAMSAHVFKEEVDRYLTSGMNAYVGKPLTLEALAKAITSATANSRATAHAAVDKKQLDADLKLIGRDAVSRIFAIVEETLPQRFVAMREAMKAMDFDRLEGLAHATYSTAASAGFTELCHEARSLELSARIRNRGKAVLALSRCEASYRQAMDKAGSLIHVH